MRSIEAETFSGCGGLRQIELPKPQPAKDRVPVRVTTAGVTPLDHPILSGGHPRAKAPLVLGNEGAGVIEDAGDSGLAVWLPHALQPLCLQPSDAAISSSAASHDRGFRRPDDPACAR